MKTLKIILLFSLFACTKGNVETKDSGFELPGRPISIKVVDVDGCEYLYGEWGNATVLTHKGNCKYCAQRNALKNQ